MSTDHTRDVVEHGQAEQERQDRWTRQAAIGELIERCARALGRGGEPQERGGAEYYRFIETACREGAYGYPGLVSLLADETPFRLATADYHADADVRDAFLTLVGIAQQFDIVDAELQNRADAVGFTLKLGEHLQDWGMNLGDPVSIVTEQAGTLKTLFFGGPGAGKSTFGLGRSAAGCPVDRCLGGLQRSDVNHRSRCIVEPGG